MNLRKITVLVVVIAALAVVPASAGANQQSLPDGVYVCNTAHNDNSGDLSVLTSGDFADPQGGMDAGSMSLTAKSNGNLNAALHSKALALCGAPYLGVSANY